MTLGTDEELIAMAIHMARSEATLRGDAIVIPDATWPGWGAVARLAREEGPDPFTTIALLACTWVRAGASIEALELDPRAFVWTEEP